MTLLIQALSLGAIIATLVGFLYYQKKKATKQRRNEVQMYFNDIATQEALNITRQEHLDVAIIGHDASQNVLLFVTTDALEEAPVKKVKLDDVTGCKITSKINYGTTVSEVRLDLESKTKGASLLLYRNHSQQELSLTHVNKVAEDWKKKVVQREAV